MLLNNKRKCLFIIYIIIFIFFLSPPIFAQGNQTVSSGSATIAVNFPDTGCRYKWVNNMPGIGLAASGTGNIPSFTAINTGSSPIIATITATPTANGFAYIGNRDDGTISVINTASNMVIDSIPDGPAYGIAVSPDGSLVYITNNGNGSVAVINTASNTQVAVVPLAGTAYVGGIAVSPDGKQVYVTNSEPGIISVINAANNTQTTNIALDTLLGGIAVSPDSRRLYVADDDNNTVAVINTATNAVTATIKTGESPWAVAVSPDGSHVYVTNTGDNTVSVINAITNKLAATISVGMAPFGIALSGDGKLAYVANSKSNTVSIINTASNKITDSVAVGSSPTGISVTPDGNEVYTANFGDNTVSVINTVTNTVAATIAVGAGPISFGNFITGGAGCSPVTFTITVNPTGVAPFIPNAFTPNGDGINDTWNIKYLASYPLCTVDIFNRYGEKLYSSIGYTVPWDGKYKGTDLPAGTYYYVINPQKGSNILSGYVTIIR